jgi:chloride channel 3/4/5
MSSSSTSQSPHGNAEASSSHPPSGRTANGKQPAIEDEASDEEALLADDPLNGGLSEQYA